MNLSNPDFNVAQFQRQDSLTGMGLGLGMVGRETDRDRDVIGGGADLLCTLSNEVWMSRGSAEN